MSINTLMSKNWAFIVITLFIFGSFTSSISGYNNKTDYFESVNVQDETTLKCYALGRYGVEETEITLSFEEAERVYNKLKELQVEINLNPFSEKAQKAKVEYIDLLAEKNLIHHSLTKNDYISLLNPRWSKKLNDNNHRFVIPTSNRQDPTRVTIPFCSITSGGAGIVYPIMVFPRPRAMLFWQGTDVYDVAVTGIGSLIMNRGCVAIGGQTGLAAGFYGVGLAYGTPFGAIYAVAGYALVATVTADEIDTYPPNARPVIWEPNPSSGETDVPLSLSELSFKLEDYNGDLMSYTVTTNPNIGSGSRSLVKDGVYTVQVGGLESSTTYTWKVSVTDGEDTLEKEFMFTTVQTAPVVSNPNPSDDAFDVPVSISKLSFNLMDPQGDLMDYSVETQPDIGTGSASGLNSGTYSIDVSGLKDNTLYTWSVTATDGTNSKTEIFSFRTQDKPFNPYEEGWRYRKKITVHHNMVEENLNDFPILVSVTDSDLRIKAQNDGDDILFMDNSGVANKLPNDLEEYDGSSGKLVTWMKVPTLSSNLDTTLYMYYGNPSCDSQQFPEKVWDLNYVGIWHLNDKTDAFIDDSTWNNYDGTKKGSGSPSETDGKIGKGQNFHSINDEYISMGDVSALEFSGDFTISGWCYPSSDKGGKICGKHNEQSGSYSGYSLNWNIGPQTKVSFRCDGGGWSYEYTWADSSLQANNWYYIVGVKKDETNYLYVNGVQQTDTGSQALSNTNNNFYIGTCNDGACANFDGTLDEIRASMVGRSSQWISTEYNNQNDPLSFLNFGPEETGP